MLKLIIIANYCNFKVYTGFFSRVCASCAVKKMFFFMVKIRLQEFDFNLTKLLQKSEMRKDIVIELSYKGFS